MFGVVFFTVFIESFVEFSKGIGDSFSRGDAFTFFVLYFCDENSDMGSECSKGDRQAPACFILVREPENDRDVQSFDGSV